MDFALTLFWGVVVWRVTRMVWTEHGPLEIFTRLRASLGLLQKRSGGPYDMVTCFYCLSVWVAVIPALFLANNLWQFLGYDMALSAAAIFLNEAFDKLK